MDIENMHPFCLPFSLCHDATSTHDDDMFCKDKNGNSSNNNNNNNISNEKERSRLKGLTSPIDDLFDCLDRSISSPSSRLLLHGTGSDDDCIIDSSDPYHALRLDIEMVTDLGVESESKIEHEFGLSHHNEGIESGDDWFTTATHDCLLFSPSDSITAKHRKSLKGVYYSNLNNNHHHHHHHQVFHVADPIDIKSSPTLAQLNLNSNDDPTDSLWDTTTTSTNTTATATSSSSTALIASTNAQLSHNNSNNLSSDLSTSRTNSLSMNGCLGSLTTCNHLNHQHSTYTGTPNLHHQNGNSHAAPSNHHHTCNQSYHHHHHHPKSGGQSTCLAVTPFRKSGIASGLSSSRGTTPQNQAHFCTSHHNHHSQTTSNNTINNNNQHSQTYRNPNNQGLSSHNQRVQTNLNNSNDQRQPQQQNLNNLAPADDQYHRQQQQQNQQCSSPVPLVTSSSSPLSTSAPTNQTTPLGNDNRLTDNKLKENIEYLTVLLCNGNNKLENKQSNLHQQQHQQQQQQQPSISSTMIKSSYSTLAQSLSTEPKLLQYNNNNNHRQASASLALDNHPSQHNNMRPMSTNEASPHCASMHQIDQGSVVSGNHQTIGCSRKSDEWFRPTTAAVESSISAADSTAENQLTTPSTDHISRNGTCLNFNNQHTGNNLMCSDLNQASRQSGGGGGEMKVLSSLLNSNTCRGIAAPASQTPTAMFASNTTNWQQNNNNQQHVIHDQAMMYAGASNLQQMPAVAFNNNNNNSLSQESSGSIPPNGRPITLTPLVSNNVIISQRQVPPPPIQQQAAPSKTNNKAPTFAQPASPSASSTTSSSGNTAEINSPTVVKIRPATKAASQNNSSQQQQSKQSTSERSGRPNSLSTDCSLSSHDEGFSSQMDQDDSCVNDSLRGDDSDDESDVDSDDESFYGDYSNSDLIGASISDNPDCKWTLTMGRTRRNGQRRFFWQYNVQSKGPKGTRISSADGSENPFVLPEASDPVFSNDCQIEGVKHSGKARRGDGNDLTPNPKKLLMIGLELKKLSKIINELAPVIDLPLNARNKTRKEKNKLASRACRLKKKAQHEANKIKLYGLQREHQQVVEAIYDIRKIIRESLSPDETMQKAQQLLKDRNLSNYVKTLIDQCSMNVAGKTSDYVNSVLEKVVSGFIDGGLQAP